MCHCIFAAVDSVCHYGNTVLDGCAMAHIEIESTRPLVDNMPDFYFIFDPSHCGLGFSVGMDL